MPKHRLPVWLKRVPGRPVLAYAAVVAVVAGGSGTTAWALAGNDGTHSAPVTDAVRVQQHQQQNPRADRDHQRVPMSKKAAPQKAAPKKKAPAHEELGSSTVTAKKADPKTAPAAGGGGGATCEASMYGTGSMTASGEPFDAGAMTAAHKTLPFGTKLRVTNTGNGDSVVVKVNDRGPFVPGRCLDLTTAAFTKIASAGAGVATVHYTILSKG